MPAAHEGPESSAARGRRRFALYAYPPNELGYCGPDDPSLLTAAAARAEALQAGGLDAIARQFTGAWPYLHLIAEANNVADPLDDSVVDAYWLGGEMASRVAGDAFAASAVARMEVRTGRSEEELVAPLALGAPLQHNYHVFVVYPWLGVLRRGGPQKVLSILDGCRIRQGTLLSIEGDQAMVQSRELVFDGHGLREGEPRAEKVRLGLEAMVGRESGRLEVGGAVSLHWDWLCEPLSPEAADRLESSTAKVLRNLA
ncbi:MAG: DUF6390 family protein [Actinomycetota bacterium]|nr:DUF6390 family protein [Actinomycetota bacterium]